MTRVLSLLLTIFWGCNTLAQSHQPPGVIIYHLPATERAYLGSPSIVKLSTGELIASCDIFGKDTKENRTLIFQSKNKGKSWENIVEVEQFWGTLFTVNDTIYLIGTIQANSDIVIRRSVDKGHSWSVIDQQGTILKGRYHTAPTNILFRNGRIYKAFEDANRSEPWPGLYGTFFVHASLSDDLLNPKSWTSSAVLFRDSIKFNVNIQGWLEGNMVVAPNDSLAILLRVHTLGKHEEYAAKVLVANGNPTKNEVKLIKFPGGSKKFDIKYDQQSKKYWSLVNYVEEQDRGKKQTDRVRNAVYLVSSTDLETWYLHSRIIHHADIEKHGFQYLSFVIEGNDLLAICRTAHADNYKGAADYHNSNFITFHRIKNFRKK